MPVAYTPDAVKALRHAFNTNVPRSIVQAHLGWDDAMFDHICNKHEIAYSPAPRIRSNDLVLDELDEQPISAACVKRRPLKVKTNVTLCLNRPTRDELVSRAQAAGMAIGPFARAILRDFVDSCATLNCWVPKNLSVRTREYVSVKLQDDLMASLTALLEGAGNPTLSALCSFIVSRHLMRPETRCSMGR
jgi:hypothetical protein